MKFQVIITIVCVVISLMIGAYHFNMFSDEQPTEITVEYAPLPEARMLERVAPLESAYRDGTVTDTLFIYEECDCESKPDTIYLPKYIETYILPEGFFDNIIKIITIITPLLVPIVTFKLNKKNSTES